MGYEKYEAIEAISNTGMSYLERSPAHYRAWRDGVIPNTSTPTQQLGITIHQFVLEPRKFNALGDIDRVNKCLVVSDKKADKKRAEKADKQLELISAIRESIYAHPVARYLLRNSRHEIIRVWKNSNGVWCKCRADCVGKTFIADLKSVTDASELAISSFIWKYKIYRQSAFYLDAFEKRTFFLITVEKTPPYFVQVYRLLGGAVESGRRKYQEILKIYENCVATGKWPYFDGIREVGLPAYAKEKAGNIDNEIMIDEDDILTGLF